jgi:phage FluMu gp28-like protein
MHLNELSSARSVLRAVKSATERISRDCFASLSKDVRSFFERVLGFAPFAYQLDLARKFEESQFLAVRWCRQSGKSFMVSALVLKYAVDHPKSYIAIVGPSWRQSKLNIKHVGDFAGKLPSDFGVIVQMTKVSLGNGSIIEAFPNNPDTIRGPTFDLVWMDEANFVQDAESLYDALLFTLGTTNGKLIATSTPWNSDSLFWKMCNHKNYAKFTRIHVPWTDALAPKGPLKPEIVAEIKLQFGDDPQRWRREMEAEWAEDQDTWLPQSLIVSCIGTIKNCGFDLEEFDFNKVYEGEFFVGLDLAQTRDYCVLAIIERLNDKLFLRYLQIFTQPTVYASVLGYVKILQDRWGGFAKIRVDFTREGPSFIKDMENAGIGNAEGVNFSVPRKSEMASLLKQRMANKKFFFPLLNWETPYRGDICNELNIERFDLRNDGAIGYSHPNGTHDDVFWAIALAVFATVEMQAFDLETVKFG